MLDIRLSNHLIRLSGTCQIQFQAPSQHTESRQNVHCSGLWTPFSITVMCLYYRKCMHGWMDGFSPYHARTSRML